MDVECESRRNVAKKVKARSADKKSRRSRSRSFSTSRSARSESIDDSIGHINVTCGDAFLNDRCNDRCTCSLDLVQS
jgi:hypothetical protein